MITKYTGKNYLYYLTKIISFFKEKINNIFSKEFSEIHLITDGAAWAVDKSAYDILNYFNKTKFKAIVSFFTPTKQFVYYIDQYLILKDKFYTNKNIIALDYQHGVKKYLNSHVKLLNYVKKNQIGS